MSASACIVFYGLRFEVRPDEIAGLEARSDPRIQAARRAGLKHYWANLGVLGPEDKPEVALDLPALQATFESTKTKLLSAGFAGEPSLYLQWRPDA